MRYVGVLNWALIVYNKKTCISCSLRPPPSTIGRGDGGAEHFEKITQIRSMWGAQPSNVAIFALLPHLRPQNQNFRKMYKMPRYYCSALVYQKRHLYHLQFLRYSADTIFPCLGHFFPFTPFVAQIIKIFEKRNNCLEIYYFFALVHQKSQSHHL